VGFHYMFGVMLWMYWISTVETETLGWGCCHLDPSSHLFLRIDTKTKHWNYSFVRFGLEFGIGKKLFRKHGSIL
jgi:hypothetical protein